MIREMMGLDLQFGGFQPRPVLNFVLLPEIDLQEIGNGNWGINSDQLAIST